MIAMALACKPQLLIADEPTTALDVTIQAQILDLMQQLQNDLRMAILLITHDMGVVAESCDVVYVMYAGEIVEHGPVAQVLRQPQHPYTKGLLASMPLLGERKHTLDTISGRVPSLDQLPKGCRFHDRCPYVMQRCREVAPMPHHLSPSHHASCHLLGAS
jgi:peptide/nickel transport system ATP-binding protein